MAVVHSTKGEHFLNTDKIGWLLKSSSHILIKGPIIKICSPSHILKKILATLSFGFLKNISHHTGYRIYLSLLVKAFFFSSFLSNYQKVIMLPCLIGLFTILITGRMHWKQEVNTQLQPLQLQTKCSAWNLGVMDMSKLNHPSRGMRGSVFAILAPVGCMK